MRSLWFVSSCGVVALLVACGSSSSNGGPEEISLGDGGFVDAPDSDGAKVRVDGGFQGPDGGAIREDRFVTTVVSFTPGTCAGFGSAEMPAIIQGPPGGGGAAKGSLDVVSLGVGGVIVVSFGDNAIVDGPGPDFIVFENAFFAGGNPNNIATDLGEVSVSEDGTTWSTFPCTATAAPYGSCAGWRPVYSAPGNGISPIDPGAAGGDPFDLMEVGVARAKFVRIRDRALQTCETTPPVPVNYGFDLDGIAILNAETP